MSTSEQTVTLADLADLVGVQTDPRDQPEALYIGLEHVGSGQFVRVGGGIAADVQSSKFAFKRNDVLYGKLRPYLDKAVLAEKDGVSTTELLVLRAKEGIDPRFLIGLVHCRDFIEHAVSGTTGSQHPRTSWHRISEFELPNFTPEEQSKIADLTWTAHNSLLACEEAIDAGTQLKRAAMRELFTRGLRGEAQKETAFGPMPQDWVETTLGTVCENEESCIQTGPFGSQLHAHEYQAEGVPVVNPTHLAGNRINHDSVPRISDERASTLSRHRLQPGDILFARRGEIGRLGLAGPNEKGWVCGTGCFLVRVHNEGIDNSFLACLFGSVGAVAWLESNAAGAIMPNLNNTVLGRLPVVCPPIDKQREIVAILDAIDRKIELHKRKRTALEELFKTLLHKLMTGEIRVADLDLSALKPAEKPEAAE